MIYHITSSSEWDLAKETNQLYPHIYGEINLDAICAVIAFPPQFDGSYLLPEGA